jgi:hypothetical protein
MNKIMANSAEIILLRSIYFVIVNLTGLAEYEIGVTDA